MRLILLVFALLLAPAASADSWMPATRAVYVARGGAARLTVTPRDVASPLAYFSDKVKGREPAGQRVGETKTSARGLLERRVGGRWVTVWDRPLVSEVAPVSALVSDDGSYVVTCDNWASMGYGDDAVAIYRGDGSLVRKLALSDILPKVYIDALPRSVSSLWWHGTDRLSADGRKVMLAVVVPNDDAPPGTDRDTVPVTVDLATGAVLPPAGPAWTRALAAATRVAGARATAEAARQAAFVAPLVAPTGTGETAWHHYLVEAFFRLDPAWKQGYPSTTMLRAPEARDYKPSEGWVREALREAKEGDVVALAAPSAPQRLAAIVAEVARALGPHALAGVRVYVAAPGASGAAIAASLRPLGAEAIVLDPATPIPQRPERLRGETPLEDLNATADDPDPSTAPN